MILQKQLNRLNCKIPSLTSHSFVSFLCFDFSVLSSQSLVEYSLGVKPSSKCFTFLLTFLTKNSKTILICTILVIKPRYSLNLSNKFISELVVWQMNDSEFAHSKTVPIKIERLMTEIEKLREEELNTTTAPNLSDHGKELDHDTSTDGLSLLPRIGPRQVL